VPADAAPTDAGAGDGPALDAGTADSGATADGGAGDAGGGDAGDARGDAGPADDETACDCRMGGARPPGVPAAFVLLAIALGLAGHRRRRDRSASRRSLLPPGVP
jgi:MYXO-CTERM domain-containing protein